MSHGSSGVSFGWADISGNSDTDMSSDENHRGLIDCDRSKSLFEVGSYCCRQVGQSRSKLSESDIVRPCRRGNS